MGDGRQGAKKKGPGDKGEEDEEETTYYDEMKKEMAGRVVRTKVSLLSLCVGVTVCEFFCLLCFVG